MRKPLFPYCSEERGKEEVILYIQQKILLNEDILNLSLENQIVSRGIYLGGGERVLPYNWDFVQDTKILSEKLTKLRR
jgi:hypothetical protein